MTKLENTRKKSKKVLTSRSSPLIPPLAASTNSKAIPASDSLLPIVAAAECSSARTPTTASTTAPARTANWSSESFSQHRKCLAAKSCKINFTRGGDKGMSQLLRKKVTGAR